MSIDRRIVSILYFNGINDIDKVQAFLGESNNYYKVIIDDEIKKLKIPGKIYTEIVEETTFEKKLLKTVEDSKKENLTENTFTLTENNEKENIDNVMIDETEIETILVKDNFEDKINDFEELLINDDVIENAKIEESIKKSTKATKTTKTTKTSKKSNKNTDSDVDDFINFI